MTCFLETSSSVDKHSNIQRNDLVWQFLELVLGSVVGKKIAVRAVIKWRYVQQVTRSAVND